VKKKRDDTILSRYVGTATMKQSVKRRLQYPTEFPGSLTRKQQQPTMANLTALVTKEVTTNNKRSRESYEKVVNNSSVSSHITTDLYVLSLY